MNTNKENKPHRHAELIKAWADGAKIQYYSKNDQVWIDVAWNHPSWIDDVEYRIKPNPEGNEPWKPREGEKYFYLDVINGKGDVDYNTWCNDEIDNALYRLRNIFPTKEEAEAAIPRVEDALKVALKGKNGDKVMSREEADSAMRSAIGICAIIDKNTSLLRENNKLKEELESLIIRCEYLQKAKEQLISQQSEIDGKPLSDGEKALIKAIRAVKIARIPEYRTSVLCFPSEDTFQTWCSDTPIAFLTSSLGGISKNKAIIDALKQIKAEQEG